MHVPYLRVSDIGPVGPGGGRAAGAAAAPPRCAKRSAKPHMVQNLRNSPRRPSAATQHSACAKSVQRSTEPLNAATGFFERLVRGCVAHAEIW